MNSYNTYFLKWAKDEVRSVDGRSLVTKQLIENPSGVKVVHLEQTNFKTSIERIDGHFWIEDLKGNMLSDCGFPIYQHKLPSYADSRFSDAS